MSDTNSQRCPQCGAVLPANAPAGLCPRCLMALNLKTETIFTDDSPAVQPPLPPEQIAPHFPQLEILECLGRGGMGVVYKARQKTLNRFVALKLLAPERVHDATFAERFAREAQALAALNHPNIVTIYDFGQAGAFYFLLMEFVDGMNLRQLLRTRKFTPEEALAIVPPLCDALQFAHERGIVHRDIKPENLLLDKSGRVKVADFGIAKMLGAANDGDPAGTSAPDNTTKTALGTPGYSAPEQKTDPQRVDSRADIYSLGVVFYEMLTGELPGQSIEAPSRKVHIDVRLDEVVLRALETKPELRYQQASDVKTGVEIIRADAEKSKTRNPTPPPVVKSSAVSKFLVAGDIFAAVLVLLTGWAVKEMGIFFNALFFFIIMFATVRIAMVIINLVCGTIEWYRQSFIRREFAVKYLISAMIPPPWRGFVWKKPLAAQVRPYWGQLLNVWIFWLLAGWVLELCMMPVQFPPTVYSGLHATYWSGVVILLLLALLPGRRIYWATNIALAIGSLFMGTQIIQIHLTPPEKDAVVLRPPFRGEWVVFNGGRSTLLNNNYGSASTRYALDLERIINKEECTGSEDKLASYPSWNEPIYAPADGTVVKVVNNLEDNRVGGTDEENPAGNRVVIQMTNGRFVTLDYLQKGSVLVSTGDVVQVGQPLARCGNSGNPGHPMLNIQVQSQLDEFAPGIKTYPIFFRDVTCLRSGHPRAGAPFFVRRNDILVNEGTQASQTSSVAAQTGTSPLSYQWQFNGVNITNPTSAQTRPPATESSANEVSQLTQAGWQLWGAHKWDEATGKFQRAVQVAPDNVDAWNGLGWSEFDAGDSHGAEAAFQKAVGLVPDHPGALNGLGQIYLSQRKYALAETFLLRAAPQAPAAWYGLARLYLLEGKFAPAEHWAQNIVDAGQADDTAKKMLEASQAKHLSEGLRFAIEPPLTAVK